MEALVWVDSWQQQCCGEDFRVGSSVRWEVEVGDTAQTALQSMLGPRWTAKIDFAESHHEIVDRLVTGVVAEIDVVTSDLVLARAPGLGPKGEAYVHVPGSGRLRRVQVADKWEPEPRRTSGDHPGWSFDGWVVKLVDAQDTPHHPSPS